ncbi:regulator of volume decrease after cellular swelling-domain-containing protein [Amylostereum chailletii]|nr:regulator of volume decrease after cellular swelling-domain-containing protein [Amylostereum chailletii]
MPAVSLVSDLPKYISPEEHRSLTGTTPASFSDIPPVLRHKQERVSAVFDPALPDFSAQDGTEGTLYVIESALVFIGPSGRGFQIEYPAITLHAISRAESGPFVYCQLDESPPAANGASARAADDDPDAFPDMRELSLIAPADSLEPIFEALSYCASLHPDPNLSEDDDMGEDGADDAFVDIDPGAFETFSGAEGEELSEVGRAALAHLDSIIYDPHKHLEEEEAQEDGQFDDEREEDKSGSADNGTSEPSS